MANKREAELARECDNLIHNATKLQNVRETEVLDTLIKVRFSDRPFKRTWFLLGVTSHSLLNHLVEGWRAMRIKLQW